MNLGVGLAILLLVAAALLLLGESRRETKKLLERSRSQSASTGPATEDIEPTIIAEAPRRSWFTAVLAWLGFADSQRNARRLPVPVVLLFGGAFGAAAGWQASTFLGPPGMLVGPVVAALLIRTVHGWELARHREEVFRQIPDAVGLMVRAVRAGLPVGEAMRSVAREMPEPTRTEFQRVLAEVGIGVPLDRALWTIHERTQLREYAFLSVVIGLQAQTGGSLAEALDNLGNIVRQRVAMTAKARALASQARASAVILVALPPVAGTGIALLQPGYTDLLFGDPRGLQMFGVAVAMTLIGILVIRGMLRSASKE